MSAATISLAILLFIIAYAYLTGYIDLFLAIPLAIVLCFVWYKELGL